MRLLKQGETIKDKQTGNEWFTYFAKDFFHMGFSKNMSQTADLLKLNQGNVSKCVNGKRVDSGGYQFQKLEMMYSGLDTLELHFDGVFGYLDLTAERAEAMEKGFANLRYNNRNYIVQDWSFKPYSFVVTDINDCFQISWNKRRIHIKVLSQAFYFDGYERLFENLAKEINALFQIDVDRFNIIRFDWAVDIKFPYKFNDFITEKDISGKVNNKINTFLDRATDNKNLTSLTNNVVFRIYDKIIESRNNKVKRDMFYRLYGLDTVEGDFAYFDYVNSNIQVLRFEYQIRNGNNFISKYALPTLKNFNPDYLRGIVFDVMGRHTRLNNDFGLVLDDVFNSPVEFV